MVLQEQLTRFIEFSPMILRGEAGDWSWKSGLGAEFFFSEGGGRAKTQGDVRGSISRRVELATFSHTQNPIIEIYLGTLQPRDFPYLPVVMFWAIWYHLYNLKNMKNTHGGVLLLV